MSHECQFIVIEIEPVIETIYFARDGLMEKGQVSNSKRNIGIFVNTGTRNHIKERVARVIESKNYMPSGCERLTQLRVHQSSTHVSVREDDPRKWSVENLPTISSCSVEADSREQFVETRLASRLNLREPDFNGKSAVVAVMIDEGK